MLFILISISFFSYGISQDFVQEPNIIQVGEYTNLICVLNYTNYLKIYKKYYIAWHDDFTKTNTNNLIIRINNNNTYNNRNITKFKIFTIDNKIILQIKNITENDKKHNFFCFYHNIAINKSYINEFINLTNLTFLNPLSSKNIKIKYFSNNIHINFEKIFPIPKCFVKINNESIYFKNIKTTKIDYLYSKVNLNMKINYSNKTKIICTLLNQNFTICLNDMYNNSIIKSSTNSTIIILVILFLIFGIILIIFIYFKKKRKEILYSLINKTFYYKK